MLAWSSKWRWRIAACAAHAASRAYPAGRSFVINRERDDDPGAELEQAFAATRRLCQ